MERLEKYYETEDLDIQVMIRLERELQIAEISVSYKGDSQHEPCLYQHLCMPKSFVFFFLLISF